MASPAEQLASSINFGALAKATELKKRLLFTLGALLVYRLGTYLPLPGLDPVAVADFFRSQSSGIIGLLDMFAGGAVSRALDRIARVREQLAQVVPNDDIVLDDQHDRARPLH